MKLLIFFILIFSLQSCSRENEGKSQMIGTWKLKHYYSNGVENNLSECQLQSKVQIPDESSATFTNFYIENNICTNSVSAVKLYKNDDGSYKVKPPSVFDQKQKIVINGNLLIYTWESWEIRENTVITKPITQFYEKK